MTEPHDEPSVEVVEAETAPSEEPADFMEAHGDPSLRTSFYGSVTEPGWTYVDE